MYKVLCVLCRCLSYKIRIISKVPGGRRLEAVWRLGGFRLGRAALDTASITAAAATGHIQQCVRSLEVEPFFSELCIPQRASPGAGMQGG